MYLPISHTIRYIHRPQNGHRIGIKSLEIFVEIILIEMGAERHAPSHTKRDDCFVVETVWRTETWGKYSRNTSWQMSFTLVSTARPIWQRMAILSPRPSWDDTGEPICTEICVSFLSHNIAIELTQNKQSQHLFGS